MKNNPIKRGITGIHRLRHTNGFPRAQKAFSNNESPCGILKRAVNNTDTYASIIRHCGDKKALSDGRQVHAHISASGRDQNTFLANLLVQMYGKCGSVNDAQTVFNNLGYRNMFSWNLMIAVYSQNGRDAEALQLYRHMLMEGVQPDKCTFLSILSASANLRDLAAGKQIHECIIAIGLDRDIAVKTALLNMYGKCGSFEDARTIFEEMHERDVVSWNAMIAAYAQSDHGSEALELYRQMNVKPNIITFVTALDACASLVSLESGRAIHEHIIADGFEWNIPVCNALVNMYGKCGSPRVARRVFDNMQNRNLISWTAMITAYAQNGHGSEALELFRQMVLQGVKPNKITFLSVLDACAILASLENGRMIHEWIAAIGLDSDVSLRNALLNMYGKCGSIKDAWTIFDGMPERDVISWNAMIAAYAQNGHAKEALKLFKQMELEGIKPDRITFLSTLDACAHLGVVENGRAVHEQIVAAGLDSNITIRNALVNMYGKCRSLKDAQIIFDKMHERNVISWTAMIAACVHNGYGEKALELFGQMDLEGLKPNIITFLSTIDACASLASLEKGRAIHDYIVASEFDSDIAVRNALVNMYGKCGSLKDAQTIFNGMEKRDAFSWNAMITVYAQNGCDMEVLELFAQMTLEGAIPDEIALLSILKSCSHVGSLDVGWQYFLCMCKDYDITPSEMHYVCMSDLLGRAGRLDEAEDLIMNMPAEPSAVAWTALLGACRIHGDMGRGARAANCAFELDSKNASPYVLLSNIYAATGQWSNAGKVRKTMELGVDEEFI